MLNRPDALALTFADYLSKDNCGCTDWSQLTRQTQKRISGLEHDMQVPISLIGTGPRHADMIFRTPDAL
jgi:adenylosuccinate synthase